jgi:hypothetical protein
MKKLYNIIQSIFVKKGIYRITKNNDTKIVFASSLEQCQAKFKKYMVIKVI